MVKKAVRKLFPFKSFIHFWLKNLTDNAKSLESSEVIQVQVLSFSISTKKPFKRDEKYIFNLFFSVLIIIWQRNQKANLQRLVFNEAEQTQWTVHESQKQTKISMDRRIEEEAENNEMVTWFSISLKTDGLRPE